LIPDFGLGTWKIPKNIAEKTVYDTIKIGVRHIDCACDYGNEVEVGHGINRAIADGIVTRSDLFITSKLWNTYHSPEHVEPAVRKSLQDLGLTYVDLCEYLRSVIRTVLL
jgi:D-xylose reductase